MSKRKRGKYCEKIIALNNNNNNNTNDDYDNNDYDNGDNDNDIGDDDDNTNHDNNNNTDQPRPGGNQQDLQSVQLPRLFESQVAS